MIVSRPAQRSYRQVLRNRRLALLLGGDVMSKIGDGMVVVALPLETLRIHGRLNSAIAISLIEAAPYTLAVALSLVFGLGRRRFRPRALILTDCALRFVVFTGVAVLALGQVLPLWVLGAALFAGSALRLLASSSRRLIATGMSDEPSRFAVNALLGTSDSLALYVAGPVLGGVLAVAVSPAFVLLLDGASFLILLLVVLIAVPAGTSEIANNSADTQSGWTILRHVPVAAWLFIVVFFFNLFYMPVEVALPLLVRGPFHASAGALGAIWTSFGIGALVGALATNQLRRLPQTALLVAIIAGWAGCITLLAAAPNTLVAAIALAVGGLVYAPFTPVAYSLIQSLLDPHQQQPVLTLWAAGTAVAAPIGLLLGGPLIQIAGIRGGLLASALLTLALVPAAARSAQRNRRTQRPADIRK